MPASYTIRDIPNDQYKALRIKAAEGETSINKTILKAIVKYLGKSDVETNKCNQCATFSKKIGEDAKCERCCKPLSQ